MLTSRGPGTAMDFALALVETLTGAENAPAGRSCAGQTIDRRASSFYLKHHGCRTFPSCPPEITMLIREILTLKSDAIYSIEPTDSVESAVAKLVSLGVGSLVVLKNGEMVGLLTERDVCRAWSSRAATSRMRKSAPSW